MIEILAYSVLVLAAVQLTVSLVNMLAPGRLPEKGPDSRDALVSILIPARNEEKNIGTLLSDVSALNYSKLEVIVYDDCSEDSTAEIARRFDTPSLPVRIIGSGSLPGGWLGKNWACHSLSLEANGSFLLFVDADVRLSGDIINRSVSYCSDTSTDLLTIFPRQVMKGTGEKLVVPLMNYILLSLLPLPLVRYSRFSSLAAANGQFMFFDSATYSELLPHQHFRDEKVEDINIARFYKKEGRGVACLAGEGLAECRMYGSYLEALNGFSKNVAAFFGNSLAIAFVFWLLTTFGFIAIIAAMPSVFLLLWFSMLVLTRIFVSAASNQSIFSNLLLLIPQHLSLGLIVLLGAAYKYFVVYKWKGREVKY